MRHLLTVLSLTLLLPLRLAAQEENDTADMYMADSVMLMSIQEVLNQNPIVPNIPPSPQAVAFNRLGDYQVNNNYGAPDINIPLFEIDFHGYKIPLTLHYEASPIKSGYNYDVTGLGWTLSGNSCVSRTIKGRADERGLFSNPFRLDSFQDNTGLMRMYEDYAGMIDQLNFQYDSYNIVLPSGRSIPFFLSREDGYMKYDLLDSDRNVKISCSYSVNSIDAFTVTDETGVTYHFTVADKASNIYINDINAFSNVTWLLTSIDIPAKGTITYEYEDSREFTITTIPEPVLRVSRLWTQMSSEMNEFGYDFKCEYQTECPVYHMRLLKNIFYGPTRVDFNYPDGRHMDNIMVRDGQDTIRTFQFDIRDSALKSIVISKTGASEESDRDKLVYGFTYTNNNPGNRTDFWGNRCYSNVGTDIGNFNIYIDKSGISTYVLQYQISNSGNIVKFMSDNPNSSYHKIKLQSTLGGDTRQPSSPSSHGVLSSIRYPNGGCTNFSFENHKFLTAMDSCGDFVFDRRSQRVIEGGGFRIKSIINYAADGSKVSEDNFEYGFTCGDIRQRNFPLPASYADFVHVGCGEAVVDPNILTFMNFSYYPGRTPNGLRQMLLGQPSGFTNVPLGDGGTWWWDAYFSANTFRSLLGGRRPVVYPEITVYHKTNNIPSISNSKTVYSYDIYDYALDNNRYYLSAFSQTASPDTAYFEPLHYVNSEDPDLACMEFPAKRHQLKSVGNYSYNTDSGVWELVSEERYSYHEEDMNKSGYAFNSYVTRGHCHNHPMPTGAGHGRFYLRDLYEPVTQRLGRFTMSGKSTTTLRQGGTRTAGNTISERYSYLYAGHLSSKAYTDVIDKEDVYAYVGEEGSSDSVIAAMQSRNMLALLTYAETYPYDDSSLLEGSKIDYASYGGDTILPYKLYESNGEVYEASVEVLSYDSHGNPTEIRDLKKEVNTVFLWDAHGRYMTAMIQGATLSYNALSAYSTTGTSRSRYESLQNLQPKAQIQTWDYKPLVGVSSYTDVSGKTMLYEYDGLGRLKSEKRLVNGVTQPELLREYEYNFRNQ